MQVFKVFHQINGDILQEQFSKRQLELSMKQEEDRKRIEKIREDKSLQV